MMFGLKAYIYVGVIAFVIGAAWYVLNDWHYAPMGELQLQVNEKQIELEEVGGLMNDAYVKLYTCEQSIIPSKIEAVVDALEGRDENISIDIYDFSY